jgi:hypothetical protein
MNFDEQLPEVIEPVEVETIETLKDKIEKMQIE